jgi:N-sulfoglucosamine sulfohydrolase
MHPDRKGFAARPGMCARRWLRRGAGMIPVLLAATSLTAAPRNVLLLISDNHNATDLGCYGHAHLQTPHLDALAARGTRFTHAFATTASCGPSRAVIYTGLLTHANGQYMHAHSFHSGVLAKGVVSVFDLAKQGGYRTALLGKASLSLGARPGQYEIDLVDERINRDLPAQAARAEQFIRDGGDRPFLVALCTHDPHPSDRPAGVRWKNRDRLLPPRRLDPAEVVVHPYLPDRPDVRESLAEYYELIERLDAGFGEALAMLQRTGKAGSTLVMFFSDHGNSYPGAYSQYEPGVHIPMIVVNPEAKKRGVVTDAMVTLADITPTILDWTGVKGPPYPLHGRSFLGILEQETSRGWDSVVLSHVMHEVTMYYPMRTLRERRYKLIWNLHHRMPFPNALEVMHRSPWLETLRRGDQFIGKRTVEKYLWHDEVELYDLQTDPDEVVNLAYDPQHADLRRALSEKLLQRLRETDDYWLERFQLPMPGESAQVGQPPPSGYASPRKKRRGD